LREINFLDIIHPLALAYSDRFSSNEDAALGAIKSSVANHPQAHMLSGHVQGKFLEMVSCLMQPTRILEIGTFRGYSTLCLAKGLKPGGLLHTIESRPQDAQAAQENFSRANAADKIILHLGNALDILPRLSDQTWDLVFIDADKTAYSAYYQMLLPRLRPGGVILADNVLFHGQVLEREIKGKNARAIHRFNELVSQDGEVEKVLLTIRDGLLMIRKK
jgi:caffeoyl-CoA O-methyltransferase